MGDLQVRAASQFARFVTLVGTAAGTLQVQRLVKEQGGGTLVASNFDDAIRMALSR